MTRALFPQLLLLVGLLMRQTPAADTIAITLSARPEVPGKARQQTVWLEVSDVKGSYSIPHIQSSRDLRVHVDFGGTTCAKAVVTLDRGRTAEASPESPFACFSSLSVGEHVLHVQGLDATGEVVSSMQYGPIGVGTIVAAIGDSITEGYYGHGFWRDDLRLTPDVFSGAAVSRDRRNYPQFSPTTAHHRPDVNCFQSWMTALNNHLTASWQQPMFIANEGWGGISSQRYLNMIRRNKNWQRRMQQLRPQLWLIHLGVNDERAGVPAETVGRNLEAIVDELISGYAAKPGRIFLARPSYDYAPGAADVLRGYCDQIDGLIKRRGLRPGPDLYAAYAKDRKRWYGTDPVHPNIDGVDRMAKLWHEAIIRALPGGLPE